MNHEICYLNSNRQFLLLDNDTWYDASTHYTYEIGEHFAIGRIKQILPYREYVDQYPEVQNIETKGSSVDFSNGVFVRLVKDGVMTYNHDPKKMKLNIDAESDLMN